MRCLTASPGPVLVRERCVRASARRANRPGESPLILGPRGSPSPGQQPGGGLILPGRPGAPPGGGPGRIVLPGDKFGGGGGLGGAGGIAGAEPGSGPGGDRPLPNRYRPPPGFMGGDAAAPAAAADAATAGMSDTEMISKLRARAGHWFQLAKLIPAMAAKGYDSNALDEVTGITPAEQNLWVVAATVYDSLTAAAAAGAARPELLRHFEGGGDRLLYHFRFLPAQRRVDAAEYIAANGLEPPECEALARAMKEWDRRQSERQGFQNTAGDCLAFKYMRDAIECRFAEEAYQKLDQGLAVAESDSARERLAAARAAIEEAELAKAGGGAGALTSTVMLTLLRLSPDELGVRPVPQLSNLGVATMAELDAAPSATQEGAFGSFTISGGGAAHGGRWVALPQWRALSLARRPAALPIPDCAANAAIVAVSQAKTDDDRRRMVGPGLLVVDAHLEGDLDPNAYYLVSPGGDAPLQLVDGKAAVAHGGGGGVAAAVLFLARPPAREGAAAATSELLQV